MMATARSYELERQVVIQAEPATVFRYFTDTARWASWWGEGSTIEPTVGGRVLIRHPGGIEVTGEVLEIAPDAALRFTYSMASGKPPQGSVVAIRLEQAKGGATRLHLTHEFAEEASRDEHVQGWRYQLSVFGNLVANEVMRDAAASVDRWFAAWSQPDAAQREAALAPLVSPAVRFRDRFSLIEGIEDLKPHLAAVHRFMPGMRLARDGEIRHCQGLVLADWVAQSVDGQERGRGTNLFAFGPDGKLVAITGFWNS
jgi:uncharacterized protein YndB with AHSA1/START domain